MEKNTIRKVKKNPYRNTFIADHILATTNEIRTRKQVASRLQHIRRYSQNETSNYHFFLFSLFFTFFTHLVPNSFTVRELIEWKKVSESQIQNIPSVLFPHTMVEEVPSDWHIPLSINIMSYSVDSGSPLPRILLQSPSQSICFRSLLGWPYGYSSFMRGMDPTIMLLSPIALNLYSTFELFENEILSLSSSTYLIPDGVDRNRLKIYILSFPDDLWKDLYRCHSFDQSKSLLLIF